MKEKVYELYYNGAANQQSFGWKPLNGAPQIRRQMPLEDHDYCRLCKSHRGLRRLSDYCIWSGNEETYCQLLAECFDVKVLPTSGYICERCVMQLRSTHKFKALVCAVFGKGSSKCSTTTKTTMEAASYVDMPENDEVPCPVKVIKGSKSVSPQGSETSPSQTVKKKRVKCKKKTPTNTVVPTPTPLKKVINICSVCGHKYPMLLTQGDADESFVCSRCKLKQNKEKIRTCGKFAVTKYDAHKQSSNVITRMTMHAKGDTKSNNRKSPKPQSSFVSYVDPSLNKKTSTVRMKCHTKLNCDYTIAPRKCAESGYFQPKEQSRSKTLDYSQKMKGTFNLGCIHCTTKSTKEPVYECEGCRNERKTKRHMRAQHYLT